MDIKEIGKALDTAHQRLNLMRESVGLLMQYAHAHEHQLYAKRLQSILDDDLVFVTTGAPPKKGMDT